MPENLLTVTRAQLAAFIKDPRTLRAFELAVKNSNEILPNEVPIIYARIEEALTEGQLASSKSNEALSILASIAESLAVLSVAPPSVLQTSDDPAAPTVPVVVPDDLAPPQVPTVQYGRPETTQKSSPSATGFNVTVTSLIDGVTYDVWLLLTPTAGFAAGTITLPPAATCVERQIISVSCTQQVSTLTVSGNGATVKGAPSALAADSTFRLRFDLSSSTWYRYE